LDSQEAFATEQMSPYDVYDVIDHQGHDVDRAIIGCFPSTALTIHFSPGDGSAAFRWAE
jgi:hypothetical protein